MDSSVYEAMVILAQAFSTNCPLIDGHGNWGSVDGDSAAAMRYTEARLSNIALEILRDIDKNTVDMVPNYSDTEKEPSVLPSRYPNLLVNGTFGIAVGLATNIPPHNLNEVIDATCALIDNPSSTVSDLMKYIKGPDLPMGGELIGVESIKQAYETGTGKVALRSKTSIETLESGRLGIIVSEFPYRKNKAKILQTISDMTGDKKHAKALELITDIRDESDRNGIRAVIEFRKNAAKEDVEKVLKYLYLKSDLQINLPFNMVAIANGKPETLGLKAILTHYINHQKEVIKRRTETELLEAEKRFHIVEGFMKAIKIMDAVVATIRASKSKQDAIINLVKEYDFSELQAEAIVMLMLYRLTNLELNAFEKEYKELLKTIKRLKEILKKEKVLMELLKTELIEIKEKYGTKRKTKIIANENIAKIDVEEIILDQDVVITLSNEGFIKRIDLKSYNRSNSDVSEIEYREGDFNKFLINSNTKETLLFFTDKGSMYQTRCLKIEEGKWKEKGIRLSETIKGIKLEEEKIVSLISVSDFSKDKAVLFVTAKGNIKKVSLEKLSTNYTKLSAMKLKNDDSLSGAVLINKKESVNLNIETEKGFNFFKEVNKVEETDRNILPVPFTQIAPKDNILSISLSQSEKIESLYISYDNDYVVYVNKDESFNKKNNFNISMDDYIFATTEKGNVLSIPSYMLINSKTVDFKELTDEKIVSLLIVSKEKLKDNVLFFFSQNGNIKKTKINEFLNDSYSSGYKIKNDETITAADFGKNNKSDIFILTKQGMCLKFKDNSFTPTGKNAGGINAIRLKDDEVLLGITCDDSKDCSVNINNNKTPLKLNNIEYKNKGTKGVEIAPKIKEVAVSLQ